MKIVLVKFIALEIECSTISVLYFAFLSLPTQHLSAEIKEFKDKLDRFHKVQHILAENNKAGNTEEQAEKATELQSDWTRILRGGAIFTGCTFGRAQGVGEGNGGGNGDYGETRHRAASARTEFHRVLPDDDNTGCQS